MTTTTTLFRRQFLLSALRSARPKATKHPYGTPDPNHLVAKTEASPEVVRKVILAVDPVMTVSTKGKGLQLIENLTLDPVYQLK